MSNIPYDERYEGFLDYETYPDHDDIDENIPLEAIPGAIKTCFVHPIDKDDLQYISTQLQPWLNLARREQKGGIPRSKVICQAILSEINRRYKEENYPSCCNDEESPMTEIIRRAEEIMRERRE